MSDGPLAIIVDLRRQMISVFRDGHEIGTAVIVYGDQGYSSPTGTFPILRRVRDYHSRSFDAPMPYSLFINNDGVALHGSPMAANRATHGCVGLPVDFARRLFRSAREGMLSPSCALTRNRLNRLWRKKAHSGRNQNPSFPPFS